MEAAEKHVRQRLCPLASTLDCLGCLRNFSILLVRRAAPPWLGRIWSLLIRPGFPQKVSQLLLKATLVAGHHRDNQRRSEDMHVITGQIREGTRERYGVGHRFGEVTHQIYINFGDL